MHTIEPYYNWTSLYESATDERSPLYGREYHDSLCTHTVYNYYIHPQWDEMGSSTLYLKILFVDYNLGFCIIELMGEWNDCLYNDIMYLKQNIAEPMMDEGINKFILIGDNVLNYHAAENDYYQEWFEEVEDGWIAILNLRDYIIKEFETIFVPNYIAMNGVLSHFNWRTFTPGQLLLQVESLMVKRLSSHSY
ncbi:MAG: hypothetical protein IH597_10010 [Bacteroidales bacterium]|nr:hypothetical protein [Bacteroidales bacterium]